MTRLAVLLLVLLVLMPAPIVACGDNPLKSMISQEEREDGSIEKLVLKLFIPYELLDAAPAWTPVEGEPHLSVGEAYKLATGIVQGNDSTTCCTTPGGISLNYCHERNDRWFYSIDFNTLPNGVDKAGRLVAVLMDGTVIKSKKIENDVGWTEAAASEPR